MLMPPMVMSVMPNSVTPRTVTPVTTNTVTPRSYATWGYAGYATVTPNSVTPHGYATYGTPSLHRATSRVTPRVTPASLPAPLLASLHRVTPPRHSPHHSSRHSRVQGFSLRRPTKILHTHGSDHVEAYKDRHRPTFQRVADVQAGRRQTTPRQPDRRKLHTLLPQPGPRHSKAHRDMFRV